MCWRGSTAPAKITFEGSGVFMNRSGFAAGQLRSFIERVENLEAEKGALAADITEIYAEAKDQGFDTKVMRAIVKLRKMEASERAEYEVVLELYKSALGMSGTPLGDAAAERLAKESLAE